MTTPSPALSFDEALLHCRASMVGGSKSFSFAARLFNQDTETASQLLYGWCRHCDDEVDQAATAEDALARLQRLEERTHSALQGASLAQPEFVAFQHLCRKYSIPDAYPLELLAGMRMDVEGHVYLDEADLSLYCYRVAGVVGLMMVHIMGISDERALAHAVSAGNAMQMTNIARDVLEDFERGRLYLPQTWFQNAGVEAPRSMADWNPETLVPVVRQLLAKADALYADGYAGLRYLPLKAAFAVGAALDIYSEIGRQVQRRGPKAWSSRTVVPRWKKVLLLVRSSLRVLRLMPARWIRPWRPAPVSRVWRPAA